MYQQNRSGSYLGMVAIFGDANDKYQHAVIAVTGDSNNYATVNAHTVNQYHKPIKFFYDNSNWDRCTFYHISGSSTNQVTLTLYVHENSATGTLLSNVHVTGSDGSGISFDKITDSSGKVVITGMPGTWQLTASKEGYNTNTWQQSITSTSERHAFITKIPITQVTLTLYVHEDSASGPLLQGVLVTGTDGLGNSFSGTTDSSGSVIISGAPGTWQFTASKSEYTSNTWSQPITITEERHAFISKTSVSPVTLTLYVHEDSATGPLLQGVLVTGTDGLGNSFSGTTDSSGLVVINGASGTWYFTASKSGYDSISWEEQNSNSQIRQGYLQKTPIGPYSSGWKFHADLLNSGILMMAEFGQTIT